MKRVFVPSAPGATAPHNQLGESATRTSAETIARLQEKAQRNGGKANRERIRARIGEERQRATG